MDFNSILDFSGLIGKNLTGNITLAREAKYSINVGFYKIQNINGHVLDPISGDIIAPEASGQYKNFALESSNLFMDFGTLATSHKSPITKQISSFSTDFLLAPFAEILETGDTFFSFKEANIDGLNHFRTFGNGTIGVEDKSGGGDQDFDDLIFGFDFQLNT